MSPKLNRQTSECRESQLTRSETSEGTRAAVGNLSGHGCIASGSGWTSLRIPGASAMEVGGPHAFISWEKNPLKCPAEVGGSHHFDIWPSILFLS